MSGNMMTPCYCDKQCSTFGDCCLDKVDKIRKWATKKSLWNCTPLFFNESVFAISNCAFDSHTCKQSCEKNVTHDDYHYILDIPVFSNSSGLYYANIYCAHCHNQLSTVHYPRVTISCTSNISIEMLIKVGKYQEGKLLWRVGDGYCILHVHDEFQKGRQCLPSEANCRIDSDPDTKAKCKAYSLPVSVSNKFYRNPHCAICNGVKISDLQCDLTRESEIPKIHRIIYDFKWKFDKCNNTPETVWDHLQDRCINLNCTNAVTNALTPCNVSSDPNNLSCQIIQQLLIRKIDAYILRICLLVSLVCLLIHIFLSFFIPNRRTVSNKMLDTFALCSVASQLLFLTGIYPPINLPRGVCYAISVCIQFSNLSTFFWTNAISFDVFYTFSDSTLKYAGTKKYSKYALYAWGGAALATLLSVVADFTDFIPEGYRPNYAGKLKNVCWFGSRKGVILFFYVPTSAIIVCNTFLFAITVCWFQKQHRSSGNIKKGRKDYNRLCLYFKLSIVMGASWIIALLRFFTHHPLYRYLFTAFSGLQGAFIFILFDMKKEAKFIIFCFRSLGQKQNTNIIQSTINTSTRRCRSSVIRAV
ncbi:adhesion G protein-coupled receptor E1 isoform X2 [Halyomorpha halys]|uniref:adhesion G protein-coupled receptor E1 isoform X2 n=1 Tax=Halyomorpha halys TaxID=286706 RepID=UPI0006D4F1FC|nr:adhesion G protein-coupled receptor E1-like isoform X2 [Halyomorpha halys]